VQGERALAWVRERNAVTEARAAGRTRARSARQAILEVLDSRDRIPAVHAPRPLALQPVAGRRQPARPVAAHHAGRIPQGRSPPGRRCSTSTRWARRGRKLGLGRRAMPGADYRRCLVMLSRGGADAKVVREFDLVDKRFVDGGFVVPEAKTEVDWVDADTSTWHRFRPRLAHRFGLPARHQALAARPAAGRCEDGVRGPERADVAVFAWSTARPASSAPASAATPTSTIQRSVLLQGGQLQAAGQAQRRVAQFWRDRVLLQLRSDWAVAGRTVAARQPAGGRRGRLPAGRARLHRRCSRPRPRSRWKAGRPRAAASC
jgi:prolyl oligopeptidase